LNEIIDERFAHNEIFCCAPWNQKLGSIVRWGMPRAGHAGWGAGRRSGLQSITAAAPRVGVWGPGRLVRRSPPDIAAGRLRGNGVTDLLRWGGEHLRDRSFRACGKRVIDLSL